MANTTSLRRTDRARSLGGGAFAGLVGALAIWAFSALLGWAQQGSLNWSFFKGPALPFLGERVMSPGFDAGAILLGIIIHLAISIGWGVLFGLLFIGLTRAATVGVGAAWGVVVWLAMFYVLLPLVGARVVAVSTPSWIAFAQHLVFGIAVGVAFLPFQRRRTTPVAPPRAQYDTRQRHVTP